MMCVFCAAFDPAFSIGSSNVVRIGWLARLGKDLPRIEAHVTFGRSSESRDTRL
jgi:hypothetical protein